MKITTTLFFFITLFYGLGYGQQIIVSTFAGGCGTPGYGDATGTSARFYGPNKMAFDSIGNLYVTDANNHRIRKITSAGVVSTFAGNGVQGSVDSTNAASSFNFPNALAFDTLGNLYVTEAYRIRKISPSGQVTTFAGSGVSGSANGTGVSASFNGVGGIKIDALGNLYVCDRLNSKIRKITPAGVVSTFATTPSSPEDIDMDSIGNFYVCSYSTLMKITPSGTVSYIVAPASNAFANGFSIYVRSTEEILIGVTNKIISVNQSGTISTLSGGSAGGNTNGVSTVATFFAPRGIVANSNGDLYTTSSSCIRKITFCPNYTITTDESDINCYGDLTGSAQVNMTGGLGVYSYDWTPGNPTGEGTSTVIHLSPGTYNCNVTDLNGCFSNESFTITQPLNPLFGVTNETNISCYGDSTGAINLLLGGGTGPYSVQWDNGSITQHLDSIPAGIYSVIVTDYNNCILGLTDTIYQPESTIVESSCSQFTLNAQTYTNSGTYFQLLTSQASGCDSLVTLHLTIEIPSSSIHHVTSCHPYTWIDGNTYSNSNTTATHTLPNAAGCDSVITLDLTINPLPTITSTDNGDATITASSADFYQWINCATNTPISGANSSIYTPIANGNYACIGTNSVGCSDTSNCVFINNVSISEFNVLDLAISPNPTNDLVTISFDGNSANYTIFDAQGKRIQTSTIVSGGTVSLKDVQTGVYFFELSTENGRTVKRVVKE